jgi:hypothetical protein
MVSNKLRGNIMGVTQQNRKLDPRDRERPSYVDDRGRAMSNPGLDGDVYMLFIAPQAAGANKVHLDLFNAETTKDIEIVSVQPIMSGAVAVVGTLAVDLYLTRTTAVGTGGTAATAESTSLTNPAISKLDPGSATLPTGVTARAAPGGGATGGAVIAFESMFPEETSVATYFRNNMLKDNFLGTRLIVPPGSGIRVVQGAVASVGNVGFLVLFSVIRK